MPKSVEFDTQMHCDIDIFFRDIQLVKFHQKDDDSKTVTVPGIVRLKGKWKKRDIATLPRNANDCLETCNAHIFPDAQKLLIILATLLLQVVTKIQLLDV